MLRFFKWLAECFFGAEQPLTKKLIVNASSVYDAREKCQFTIGAPWSEKLTEYTAQSVVIRRIVEGLYEVEIRYEFTGTGHDPIDSSGEMG